MDYNNIFFVSDLHGDMNRLNLIKTFISNNDLLIILGDACIDCRELEDGIYTSHTDFILQNQLKMLIPCDILILQGNHDRPFEELNCEKVEKLGASLYYKNGIFFVPNGSSLNINEQKFLFVGGACSINKDKRKHNNELFFENEEMANSKMIELLSTNKHKHFDFVLTHTSPSRHIKKAILKDEIKLSRTEKFLNALERTITYDNWLCGHLHKDYSDDKFHVIYNNAMVYNKNNGLGIIFGKSMGQNKK